MKEDLEDRSDSGHLSRATLVRDVAVLQVKLFVDGLRDLLLVPVSIAAGIVSILKAGDQPGTAFYDLLHYGRRTEKMIDLFGAADRVRGAAAESDESLPNIDDMMTQVESFVIDEYRSGGITAEAKRRIESILQRVQNATRNDA